jgi:cyclophilin family peptidyl-prolyl cis-trans isomerase/protein-disulfide isomerase
MRFLTTLTAFTLLLSACSVITPGAVATPTPTLPLNFAGTPLPDSMECVTVSEKSTPQPTEPSLFSAPAADDWSTGPVDALVTFLEYTDFQAAASPPLDLNLARLAETFPTQVRRVFRHFPLPGNDKALLAAAAAEAAGQQAAFWQMNRMLIEKQAEWVALSPDEFRAWLLKRAADLKLDQALFSAALEDPAVQSKLAKAQEFGLQSAIPTMPWLLINGKIYQGPRDFRSLDNLVRLLVFEERQFDQCPPFVIDLQKQYFARLATAKGEVLLQLYPLKAPLAVNNFVYLARQGWYNSITFHRVIPGYIAQTGDPSGSGFGTPGYAFPDDHNDLRFDQAGVLAMANAGRDSNGSQFFITYKAIPELNGQYAIFGKVLEGIDVLGRLTPRDPSSSADLPEGDILQSVTIEER